MVKFLKRQRVFIASVTLCLLALQIVSTNDKGIGGTVITGRVVSAVTAPIQYAITSTIEGIRTTWVSYLYLVSVRSENNELKQDIARLTEENSRLKEAVLLNERLKELLAFKEESAVPAVAARVIGVEDAGWIRTAHINKGAQDGITRDMAVVTSLGVVGRVIDVQPTTSEVLLITDPRCDIGVIVQRSRIRGITEGNGTNRLIVKYVNHGDDVQIGDVVISSGIGDIFPKGMVVGEVVQVEKGEDNFFMNIEVKPSAHLHKLEEVLIITGGSPNTFPQLNAIQ